MAKAASTIPSAKFDTELVPGQIKGAMKTAEASEKSGLWMVPLGAIRRIDGFNVRIETPDYESHRESIAQSIVTNGFYPNKPLAGYVAQVEGEPCVFITDGYTRLSAAELAVERGAELDKLPIILKPATENMVDLTVALVQDNEGRPLTPFEKAIVVKRLISYGAEKTDIASRLSITERYVSDLEVLAGAPAKVRKMVIDGKIAPTEAIKQLRKDPAKAAEKLQKAVDTAAAEGKSRASAKHVEDDGDEDVKHVTMKKTVSKGGQQREIYTYKLKGGQKVPKGTIETVLNVDNGSFWREPEDLDDAAEGDVVITKSVTITLTIQQAAAETDSGDAPSGEDIDSSLDGDDKESGADDAAGGDGDGSEGL